MSLTMRLDDQRQQTPLVALSRQKAELNGR